MSDDPSASNLLCFFVSDLHGKIRRFETLLTAIERERPAAVFIGGDILPHPLKTDTRYRDFGPDILGPSFERVRDAMREMYPRVFLILGNDDPRREEPFFEDGDRAGLWTYAHMRCFSFDRYTVCGYACVPPTPFQLKDWECYDVSRYVDPGDVSPEEGRRTVRVSTNVIRYATIQKDIDQLTKDCEVERLICLFHAPPYQTNLDRVDQAGKMVDHVPLDVNVGSIAIRRFIEKRQPLLTLHGHIHESARLTGDWQDRIGRTVCLSAAHDGPELALVRFDPSHPEGASRELL
ncbi:metallophosphoesterase [bacterium]|nr:metallophosphoesterase [bacterium]